MSIFTIIKDSNKYMKIYPIFKKKLINFYFDKVIILQITYVRLYSVTLDGTIFQNLHICCEFLLFYLNLFPLCI